MYRKRTLPTWQTIAWAMAWPIRAAYLIFLLLVVWDTRRYLQECASDGLLQSLSLTAFRDQLDRDVARADALRRVLRSAP